MPDALCNNNLSQFVMLSALCNNNLLRFVTKLLCCVLQYKICQKIFTLCNKIIISIYLPIFLPNPILYLLPEDLSPPYLACWWFKVKDHLQQSHVTLWPRGQMIKWPMKIIIYPLPWDLWLLNLTWRQLLMKRCYP